MSPLLIATIAAPLVTSLIPIRFGNARVRQVLRIVLAAASAGLAFASLPHMDRLSALFVMAISLLSLAATAFSTSIFPKADQHDTLWSNRPAYFALLGAFWSSMLYAVASTNFIGLWIGISATTLATTFLVGYSGGKASLEAAWKYLVLCSFGIAIALIGMLLLGRAAILAGIPPNDALSWQALTSSSATLSPALTRIALLLMLLGFGTKAGLVPMHAWLPDAHSKAPAPVSALLSGLLVSCALYALMRVQSVATHTPHQLVDQALLILGCASILVAAMLMLAQRDVKRLLSYSTVEHAGLIAVALGLATPLGAFAALAHVFNHAFTKSLAFLSIGIVQYERGTTSIRELRGLANDGGGKLFLAAIIGLAGLPPFGIFITELLIVFAAAAAHQWIVLGCATLGLLLSFAALARLAIDVESGPRPSSLKARTMPRLAFITTGCAASIALLLALVPFTSWAAVISNAALSPLEQYRTSQISCTTSPLSVVQDEERLWSSGNTEHLACAQAPLVTERHSITCDASSGRTSTCCSTNTHSVIVSAEQGTCGNLLVHEIGKAR